jgi:hypothetical protein
MPTILAVIERPDRITATASGITATDEFALCRRLLAAGYDSRAALLTFWPDGRPSLRIASLAAGAQWTIRETPNEGPRRVRWKPPPHAPSAGGGRSPVRESLSGGAMAPTEGAHA